MTSETQLAYRRSAAEGASPIGLVILLYDTLAGDLRRAAAAAARQDIPVRCKESNHALLVLGHLDSWLSPTVRDALTVSLREFYAYLRGQILYSQRSGSHADLNAAAQLVLETRAVWQRQEETLNAIAHPSVTTQSATTTAAPARDSSVRFACSA